ncbi:LamG-like jellyroll fold domain-containing protein [Polluticoccus soli]|uniref:LamG-like jellyroll fold domain-containing protein n=1 Tax=Polluticoccus soli TaxID=3034150 RepID=UPI0023E213BB|nr:LamG-like jellyroll fold domain-containing protein [Flavipsychrobacter sp. JY13-12]
MKRIYTLLLLLSCTSLYGQGYNGLVARWPFNGNANDVSGHALHGTVFGAVSDTGYNGQPNNAYKFDGVDDYILVNADSSLNISEFSICALVQPMGFYAGPCQANTVLYRNYQTANDHYGLQYYDNAYDDNCNVFTPTHEVFAVNSSGTMPLPTTIWNDTQYINEDQWYCVVGTFSKDTLCLYVDGVLRKKLPWANEPISSNNGLSIGAKFHGGLGYFMNGRIDELRLYDRALTINEVNEIKLFCDSAKAPVKVADWHSDPKILMYPNPVTDILNIQIPSGQANIEILDIHGKKTMSETHVSSGKLDLRDLPTGLYFIKLTLEDHVVLHKFHKL